MVWEKRGTSHLGFVLSFVIFLTFLLFMYAMIEPVLKIQPGKETLLNDVKNKIVGEFEVEDLVIVTVKNTSDITSQQDCIVLQHIIGLEEDQIPESYVQNNYLSIRDLSGNNFDYVASAGDKLKIGVWVAGDLKKEGYFLKIYYSEEVKDNSGVTGTGCTPTDDYEMSSKVTEESYISESKITDLKNSYETDYAALKTSLDIPAGSDFTFTFSSPDNSTSISPENVDIPDTNIYVSSFPIDYFDSDANLKLGILKVTVW